ncbi:hypothetical protein IGI39_004819 [Enterococcus sp. AZ135]|uniref:IS30 family transposase n=2 Tax=unclassified Enterococcus TaxID=2608891 RepID=UPI003F200CD2
MGSHKKLTRDNRKCIETMIYDAKSIQEIADRIGVSRTTIDRELKRVPEDLIYNADNAQLDAEMKRSACGAKSKWTSEFAYQIECDLEDSWSPEQIANDRQIVSFKTIYNWLYAGILNVSKQCLRHKGRRQEKQEEARGKMTVGHTIDERPASVSTREEFGHWELDTVVSSRGESKACEATFIERKTRFYWAISMRDRTAKSLAQAIKAFVQDLGSHKAFLSFTVDRGKEFSCWKEIEKDLDVPMYFCDPYSPWQRGSNENGNGLFREFFPKGTDFSKVTPTEKQEALRKINMRPKKTLNWKNCWEVFQEEMLQLI